MNWTQQEALCLLPQIESGIVHTGYHVGMLGSVLHKGFSTKDLDIVIYPHHKGDGENFMGLVEALIKLGFSLFELQEHKKYADTKTVYKATYKNKRIDIFLLR